MERLNRIWNQTAWLNAEGRPLRREDYCILEYWDSPDLMNLNESMHPDACIEEYAEDCYMVRNIIMRIATHTV